MNYNFKEIFSILEKESEKFTIPSVTEISNINKSPYQTLISCLISLRTKDAVTLKASKRLLSKAPTPKKMIKLKESEIASLIHPANYYLTKAKRIREISKVLIKNYKGKVPLEMDELLKLKGVGRKTANIVLVYGHNKEGLPIDVHCSRIPNRLGWIKTKNANETEQVLRKILPKQYWNKFNDLFVKFGQNICVPVSPYCSKCPINKYCKKVDVKTSR